MAGKSGKDDSKKSSKAKLADLPKEVRDLPLVKNAKEEKKGKEISLEEVRRFVRGEITLAQLEGLTREQLYDFAELGYTLFKSGKLDDACKVFEGLVTYNPYDAYFHSALGAIYQKQKRYDEAIRQYNLAVKFNSEDTCSLTNRGETYLMIGRLEEAAKDFQKAIELDPEEKDPWSMRSRALVIAVTNALQQGQKGQNPSK